METLADHSGLKNCVLGTELPQILAVSVTEGDALTDTTNNDAVGVSYVTTADRPSACGASALVTSRIRDDVQHNDMIQPEELGGQQLHVPLLTGDSADADAVALASNNHHIIQQYIDPNLEGRGCHDKNEDTPEVIFVYQDIFTCGACSKQFVDLSEFLEHKTHHTIGTVFHKCDLCQMIFRSQPLICDHYLKVHQINFHADGTGKGPTEDLTEKHDNTAHSVIAASIEDLAATDKDGQVDSVIIPDGLAIGIVNGEICAAESNKDQDATVHLEGSPEQQVLFVQNGFHSLQDTDLATVCDEPSQGTAVAIEGLSTADATSAGITVLKEQANEENLLNPTLSNGLKDILNGNAISTDLAVSNSTNGLADSNVVGSGDLNISTEILPGTASKPDFNFILQTEMIKGSTFTYGKTWFKCLHCEFKTNTKVMISKHMQDEHIDLIELHQNMDIKDVLGSDKRKIMKMSTYETIFGRESRFRRRAKKAKRIEKSDTPTVYKCGTCGKVFTRTRYLRKHQSTHRTEKKYLCDECGKAFKSRTYLQVHRRIHKEKLFHCNQCNFSSKINAAIHAHRQVHSQGSVLCDICGYAYTDKSTLSKHKRVHDLNRPYKCNFSGCTWRFKTEVMCKAHIRAHTTEGKFKCSFCGYLFRHKHHLQRHESSMHGVKHTKTRTNQINRTTGAGAGAARKAAPQAAVTQVTDADDALVEPELTETVNLVINADAETPVQLQSDSTQHLVVATDPKGTPIAFEGTDISALNVAYQTLFQNQEGSATRTLIMTQPETQIIFKQGY